jgi:NAD dependent epimerase/dehydratase family enzyme
MFEDLFAQVERTGQLSFTNLFRTVAPLLADLVRRVVQIDLSGLLGEVGGLLSGASGSRRIGVGDLFGVGRSIVDLIGGVAGG